MIAKIDLEKAYDRIDWNFLEAVLKKVCFGKDLLQVIMNCIKSTSLVVIWNGNQLEAFKSKWGLQQGDPLSLYLFVLCMETLAHNIRAAADQKEWRPVRITKSAPPVTYLFFGEASIRQVVVMKQVLDSFYKESGEKVSLPKSRIWSSPSTPDNMMQAITTHARISSIADLGKYLGIPLLHSQTHRRQFQYPVDKLNRRVGMEVQVVVQGISSWCGVENHMSAKRTRGTWPNDDVWNKYCVDG